MIKTLFVYFFLALIIFPCKVATAIGGKTEEDIKSTANQNEVAIEQTAFRSFHSLEASSIQSDQAANQLLEEGPTSKITDSVRYYVAKARSVIAKVKETNNFIKYLDATKSMNLPVGITKTIGGLSYMIGIDSVRLTPTHAEFDAYLEFIVPQNGQTLTFVGKGIKFTKAGGIVGDARLELVTDYAINFDNDKGQVVLKGSLSPSEGTFATMDCNGFKEMSLEADIVFSRDLIVPENADGTIANGRVKSSFATKLADWNDLIVSVSLPSFQVPDLKGVGFTVKQAIFDFSDIRNAPGIKYPKGYEGIQAYGDTPNLWRGFYLQELSIRLPQQFEQKGTKARTEFYAYDMLIDNMGFSGEVIAKRLISRDKGKMGEWAFSLDSLYINLVGNQIQKASFEGDVVVPIAPDNPFGYSAIINPGDEYIISISPEKDLEFDLWKAGQVDIYSSSYMEVSVEEGKFYPQVHLHGNMSIAPGTGDGGAQAKLADIEFEDLRVATRGTRLNIGALSLGSGGNNNLANFPFTVKDIGVVNEEGRIGLRVHIALNLMKASEEGFAADGEFIAWGRIETETGAGYYFDKLEVQELGIDVVKPNVYELRGRVQFFRDDATYGNGFRGILDAELGGIDLEAVAIFGNTGQYRYWYADAMLVSNTGLPMGAGFAIYGFGGGVYHNMRQQGYNEKIESTYGQSSSGIIYVPDEAVYMGFKASVAIGAMGKKEAFNGDATFEINLNRHGGINQVGFLGNVYFMTNKFAPSSEMITKGTKLVSNGEAQPMEGGSRSQVKGRIELLYDHSNKVFHGDIRVYIDAAGGLVKGIGPNSEAGWAILHFEPGSWYIHIGTPDNPVGLQILSLFKSRSYFMMGHEIPGSPPPPANVVEILGGKNLDYMRDLNALGTGQGLAFGAHFSVSTGEKSFLIFYGSFAAGAGFDIMVKDYGEEAICQGQSGPIGINGWYANGQAYAFVEGKIGIKVDLTFYKGKYDILDIGAAAVMQAKGPSPFWMRGVVGGRYNILGGLVRGTCSFEVTIGEECKIVTSSPLGGVEVIAELTPINDEKDVSVFNTPQALFNMPINQVFSIKTDDGIKSYRIKLDHFEVVDGGKKIAGAVDWNADHDVAAFNTFDIFPSKKELKARVQISFEEKKSGSWQPVVFKGKIVTESMEVAFTTGIAPDYIPLENVAYSYPMIDQYNFYQEEIDYGYIKLIKGQPELFDQGVEWEQKVRFSNKTDDIKLINYKYDATNRQISFEIPAEFKNNAIYAFELVNLPVNITSVIDSNVDTLVSEVDIIGANEGTDMSIRTKVAEGTIEVLQEKQIFETQFRTSYYNTFKAKFEALNMQAKWKWSIAPMVEELKISYVDLEGFDKHEIWAQNPREKLILFEAMVTSTNWYKEFAGPVIYYDYPFHPEITTNREDTSLYGVPPIKAIHIEQDWLNTAIDINIGRVSKEGRLIYHINLKAAQDFASMRNKAAAMYFANNGDVPDRLLRLYVEKFRPFQYGRYPAKATYRLPGTLKTGTNKTFYFEYQRNEL